MIRQAGSDIRGSDVCRRSCGHATLGVWKSRDGRQWRNQYRLARLVVKINHAKRQQPAVMARDPQQMEA